VPILGFRPRFVGSISAGQTLLESNRNNNLNIKCSARATFVNHTGHGGGWGGGAGDGSRQNEVAPIALTKGPLHCRKLSYACYSSINAVQILNEVQGNLCVPTGSRGGYGGRAEGREPPKWRLR